jgi:hypothetical protein
MTQSCKTCAHLDVKPDERGHFVVRRSICYQCLAPVPELPHLPDSVTLDRDFRWPPTRSWVTGADGAECPAWSLRLRRRPDPEADLKKQSPSQA